MTWTAERELKLRIYWMQGLSAAQIAKNLGGVTRNAVIGKRVRMGLPDRETPTRTKRRPKAAETPRIIVKGPLKVHAPASKASLPPRGPNSIRFIDRASNQCPMFCEGEEGPEGLVCGEEARLGESWCSRCSKIVWLPVRPQRAKAA